MTTFTTIMFIMLLLFFILVPVLMIVFFFGLLTQINEHLQNIEEHCEQIAYDYSDENISQG